MFFKALLSPLALAWFYTNSDFLLHGAGKAVLRSPEEAMTPVRKNKQLPSCPFITSFEPAAGESR